MKGASDGVTGGGSARANLLPFATSNTQWVEGRRRLVAFPRCGLGNATKRRRQKRSVTHQEQASLFSTRSAAGDSVHTVSRAPCGWLEAKETPGKYGIFDPQRPATLENHAPRQLVLPCLRDTSWATKWSRLSSAESQA